MMTRFSFLLSVFLIFIFELGFSADFPIAFETDVENIYSVLKSKQAKNIEEAVGYFDSRFFEKGNFRLYFNSQSIQRSSLEYPRIVLMGQASKIYISFNHRLGEQRDLEVIQFRESSKKWEFRSISFEGSRAVLSSANPAVCLHCHGGQDAKPNVLRLSADRLERAMPYPSLSRFSLLEKNNYWISFMKNSNLDQIYSRLAIP